jgi:hypothetical protein
MPREQYKACPGFDQLLCEAGGIIVIYSVRSLDRALYLFAIAVVFRLKFM